jgi:hypothetical protein
MSDERLSDPNEESAAAIDPPGNTGTEPSANLDAPNSADGEVAIDPPGNT